MIEDNAASRPEEGAEGEVLIIRGDLDQAGFTLLLEPGVEDATVSLLVLEGVGFRPTVNERDMLP